MKTNCWICFHLIVTFMYHQFAIFSIPFSFAHCIIFRAVCVFPFIFFARKRILRRKNIVDQIIIIIRTNWNYISRSRLSENKLLLNLFSFNRVVFESINSTNWNYISRSRLNQNKLLNLFWFNRDIHLSSFWNF